MKRYRIRDGSIADYARVLALSVMFWGVLIAVAVQSYPA